MALRTVSIRTYLIGFVACLMLPMLAFAGLLLWQYHQAGVEQYKRDALERARRISATVDMEIAATLRSLQVLSTSLLIREKRFEELYKQALQVKDIIGSEVIIKDATGQQLVNTRLPWGSVLPRSLPERDRQALQERTPTVSDLFVGAVAARPIVSINVPIIEGGQVIGLINTGIDPSRLSALLETRVPESWTGAIVDRNGLIVARSRLAEQFVGKLATADLRAQAIHEEGTWIGWTADRIAVVAAYHRSPITGWRAAVGVPQSVVQAPLWRSLVILALFALIGVLTFLTLAHLLVRHLGKSIDGLVAAARAVGKGETLDRSQPTVTEFQSITEALRSASEELQALRGNLERQVEERTRELIEANERLVAEVNQREKVEEQLRHSQKMDAIGQLTGGLAHGFNNLLAVISGSLQMLQRRMERGEIGAMLRYIDSAKEGTERAAKLTHRLLAFARQQPLSPNVTDINKLVKGMSELLHRSLGETITIETVLAGGLWRTRVDANQLENAILNLALNARDAMPDGGKLTIETTNAELDERYAAENPGAPVGQFVMIAVTDTGKGMPPDVLARAFDPFFTTKASGQGTGLGLSQVYGFVRQSGGHVKIYSEIGVGSSVKIYLPRFLGEALEPVQEQARLSIPRAKDCRTVLVVEDEEAVRRVSVEYLQELGYRALEAENGAAALRILDAQPDIDLLFTDVVMPEMDGKRLAEEALRKYPHIKVIFTTGYTRNAVVHGGTIKPEVLLLTKPFSIDQLAGKIAQAFGNS
jgi:signal transduction histidine kinase